MEKKYLHLKVMQWKRLISNVIFLVYPKNLEIHGVDFSKVILYDHHQFYHISSLDQSLMENLSLLRSHVKRLIQLIKFCSLNLSRSVDIWHVIGKHIIQFLVLVLC